MLKTFYKVIVLSVFLSVLSFAQNTNAAEVTPMSAEDFAEKVIPQLKKYLGEEAKYTLCGTKETLCKKSSEYCLRCYIHSKSKIIGFQTHSSTVDLGMCVSKDLVKKFRNDIQPLWPTCVPSYFGGSFLGTGVKAVQRLTFEPYGFTSTTEASILGYELYSNLDNYTGNDGNRYMLHTDNNNPSIEYGNNDYKGCEVLPVKMYNMQECYFCPMARSLFRIINEATKSSFSVFKNSLSVLMIIVYIVWLAITTLKQVFVFTKVDAANYIESVLKQSFKFVIAFLLLLNSSTIFNMFISPVLGAGLKMGSTIQAVPIQPGTRDIEDDNIMVGTGYFNVEYAGGTTLYLEVQKYLSSVQGQLGYMQAIGSTLFCVGSKQFIFKLVELKKQIVKALRMIGIGIILIILGLTMSIVFGFFFLDAVMQLGLLGMMMPLMIAGWPFALTKKMAGTGLNILMNTFFIFFFTGFVVSVNVILIDQSLKYALDLKSGAEAMAADVMMDAMGLDQEERAEMINQAKKEHEDRLNLLGKAAEEGNLIAGSLVKVIREDEALRKQDNGLNKIANALNSENIENVAKATMIDWGGFVVIVFAAFFGFRFTQEVGPLAGRLADGAGVDMISQMGVMVGQGAKGAVEKAYSGVKGVGGKLWKGAKRIMKSNAAGGSGGAVAK